MCKFIRSLPRFVFLLFFCLHLVSFIGLVSMAGKPNRSYYFLFLSSLCSFEDGYSGFSGGYGGGPAAAATVNNVLPPSGPGRMSLTDSSAPSFAASSSGFSSAPTAFAPSSAEPTSFGPMSSGLVQPTTSAAPASGNVDKYTAP